MYVINERSGDIRRFEEALKMAKSGIMEACEIWNSMKEQFSERGYYVERYSHRYEPDWMPERRHRW